MLVHATSSEQQPTWTRKWPRCSLLVQLTLRCARNRNSQSTGRLLGRIEVERRRMRGAPCQVEVLLNEIWYAATLLVRGDRAEALQHAEAAQKKAKSVADLLTTLRCAEARGRSLLLCQRSFALQQRVKELLNRSQVIRSRCEAIFSSASLHR
jgi:hypothetical protein